MLDAVVFFLHHHQNSAAAPVYLPANTTTTCFSNLGEVADKKKLYNRIFQFCDCAQEKKKIPLSSSHINYLLFFFWLFIISFNQCKFQRIPKTKCIRTGTENEHDQQKINRLTQGERKEWFQKKKRNVWEGRIVRTGNKDIPFIKREAILLHGSPGVINERETARSSVTYRVGFYEQ